MRERFEVLTRAIAIAASLFAACGNDSRSDTRSERASLAASHRFRSGATVELPDGARGKRDGSGGMGDSQTLYTLDAFPDRYVHVMELASAPRDCRLRLLEVEEAAPSPVFVETTSARTEIGGEPALRLEAKLAQGPLSGKWLSEVYVCRNGVAGAIGVIAPELTDEVRVMARSVATSFDAPVPEGWGVKVEHTLRGGGTLTLPRGATTGDAVAQLPNGVVAARAYELGGDLSGLVVGVQEFVKQGECGDVLERERAGLQARRDGSHQGEVTVGRLERRSIAGAAALYWEQRQRKPDQSFAALLVCGDEELFSIMVGPASGPVGPNMRSIARVVADSYEPTP